MSASVSGAAAGLFTAIAFQPFDVVKTRVQEGTLPAGSMREALLTVARKESPMALWRGTAATVARIVPGCGIYFGLLSKSKQMILARRGESGDGALTAAESLATGAICRGLADVAVSPLTVIKARLESAGGARQYRGVLDAFRCMCLAEGPRALYAGLGATLLRDAPYAGTYYLLYERLKLSLAASERFIYASDAARNFAAACGAGALATLITHPPDVVKTRLQLQRYGPAAEGPALAAVGPVPPSRGYAGVLECTVRIVRDEGASSLLRGFYPRLIKRTLSSAVTWTLYEHIYKLL